MKNKSIRVIMLIIAAILILYAIHTFALMRTSTDGNGTLNAATWNVARNHSQSDDSIDIERGDTDSYTLTVQSNSEVDVLYKIIISNLPTGVEVDIDNTGYQTPTNGSLTIENANTAIMYNDSSKTKKHTLTFKATDGATLVTEQKIDIDVEFRQNV